jgi:hypothetical protein
MLKQFDAQISGQGRELFRHRQLICMDLARWSSLAAGRIVPGGT